MDVTDVSFFPTTLEGVTTVGANLVTMGAAVTIGVIIQVQLSLIVYFQRRAAYARAAITRQEAKPPVNIDPQNSILNSIYLWAEHNREYSKGMSPQDVRRMSAAQRRDYQIWVSSLVAALDIVFLTDAYFNDGDTMAKIEQTLSEHAPVLTKGWPFYRPRYPVSDKMAALIKKVVQGAGP